MSWKRCSSRPPVRVLSICLHILLRSYQRSDTSIMARDTLQRCLWCIKVTDKLIIASRIHSAVVRWGLLMLPQSQPEDQQAVLPLPSHLEKGHLGSL